MNEHFYRFSYYFSHIVNPTKRGNLALTSSRCSFIVFFINEYIYSAFNVDVAVVDIKLRVGSIVIVFFEIFSSRVEGTFLLNLPLRYFCRLKFNSEIEFFFFDIMIFSKTKALSVMARCVCQFDENRKKAKRFVRYLTLFD